MSIIDEMWYMHLKSFDFVDIEEPLYCNITGGLDSRVLAGVARHLGYKIADGHYAFAKNTKDNIDYVEAIHKALDYKNFHYYLRPFSWEGTKRKDLGKYIYLFHPFGNFSTGMYRNRSFLREKWFSRMPRVFEAEKYFKKVVQPFDNIFYVGYMTNLPMRYHFQQYGYRMMIKKYLPDLWDIPRCFEKGQKPVPLNYYIPRRMWNKLWKR